MRADDLRHQKAEALVRRLLHMLQHEIVGDAHGADGAPRWRSSGMRPTPRPTMRRGSAAVTNRRGRSASPKLAPQGPRPARRARPARCRTRPRCRRSRPRAARGRPRTSHRGSARRRWRRGRVPAPARRRRGAASVGEATARPTISSARVPRSAPALGRSATLRPSRSTTTRSHSASTSASLWLMKITARPRAASALTVANRLSDLLRRQHRGRLVEHEDARVAIERLEDLDALLLADRELRDAQVERDIETEVAASAHRHAAAPRSGSARAR